VKQFKKIQKNGFVKVRNNNSLSCNSSCEFIRNSKFRMLHNCLHRFSRNDIFLLYILREKMCKVRGINKKINKLAKKIIPNIFFRTKTFIVFIILSGIYLLCLFEFYVPLLELLPQENFVFITLLFITIFFFYKVSN
jgi:hypothetical protein